MMNTVTKKNFKFFLAHLLFQLFAFLTNSSTDVVNDEILSAFHTDVVALFTFNGGSTHDTSGQENHGTLHGTLSTQDSFGNMNSSFEFDGVNSYIVRVDPTGTPSGNNAYSISVFSKSFDFSVNRHMVSFGDTASTSKVTSLCYLAIPGTIHVAHYDNDWNTGFVPSLFEYTHYVTTYDGSVEKLYVNSSLVAIGGFSNFDIDPSPLVIGASAWDGLPSDSFHGVIDIAVAFNRALSETEVNSLYDIVVQTRCYEVKFNNDSVCSSNGICNSQDNCTCFLDYEGEKCEIWFCYGYQMNDTSACSGNGACLAPDQCVCDEGTTLGGKCSPIPFWMYFMLIPVGIGIICCGVSTFIVVCVVLRNCGCFQRNVDVSDARDLMKKIKKEINSMENHKHIRKLFDSIEKTMKNVERTSEFKKLSLKIAKLKVSFERRCKELKHGELKYEGVWDENDKFRDGKLYYKKKSFYAQKKSGFEFLYHGVWRDGKLVFIREMSDEKFGSYEKKGYAKKMKNFNPTIYDQPFGKGQFSCCYIFKEISSKLCCKLLNSHDEEEFLNECRFSLAFKHKYIVKCHGWFKIGRQYVIVSDYCDKDNWFKLLQKRIRKGKGLTWKEHFSLLKQTVLGMIYLHDICGLLHRDLKLDNVLIKTNRKGKLEVRITDFGTSKKLRTGALSTVFTKAVRGSYYYTAPEILKNVYQKNFDEDTYMKYSKKSDVFSFGVMMMICYFNITDLNLLGKCTYTNPQEATDKNWKLNPPLVDKVESDEIWIVDLMMKCCSSEVSERPFFGQILEIFEKNSLKKQSKREPKNGLQSEGKRSKPAKINIKFSIRGKHSSDDETDTFSSVSSEESYSTCSTDSSY